MVRWGRLMVVATATATMAVGAAGCGSEPAPPAPPPAPVAPVDADGQPITTLCDLLSEKDITEVTGIAATKPGAEGASPARATCRYGNDVQVIITTDPSLDDAQKTYRSTLLDGAYSTVIKEGPIGGVDESVYAMGSDASALGLRRQKLVVSIILPGTPDQAEIKLIQLAGRLLSRANALGT